MFVTSGPEVLLPSAADVICVNLDQCLSRPELALVQTYIVRHLDPRLKPELRLPVGTMHMHVHPRLFAREKVEAKSTFAEDRRAHDADKYLTQANA
jgi:hypothetical protein